MTIIVLFSRDDISGRFQFGLTHQAIFGEHMIQKVILGAALAAGIASPALSGELVFGLGHTEYSRSGSEDGAVLALEYLHSPFYQGQVFSAHLAGAVELVETGDAFIGGGISGNWDLQRGWFIEASMMPGAYFESAPLNDLGSTFEIRSQIALGKRFNSGKALSLALSHKSNASTADINPGVNVLALRWHVPLD
ncbi:acyloxyacyl hydrolase [Pseudophaeobacter sp.]|uniref:acyloxyacyl hydrolase n=1 Tax=Pseudophaeobacter sp. TaxID=1971739 RepID=UPI004058B2A7